MGTWYTFKCEKCNHEFQSSGKTDWGFMAVVKPFKCIDCNDIVDVTIGERGQVFKSKDEFSSLGESFMKCPKCKGENLKPWNPINKKCPKCGGRVNSLKDIDSIVLWD